MERLLGAPLAKRALERVAMFLTVTAEAFRVAGAAAEAERSHTTKKHRRAEKNRELDNLSMRWRYCVPLPLTLSRTGVILGNSYRLRNRKSVLLLARWFPFGESAYQLENTGDKQKRHARECARLCSLCALLQHIKGRTLTTRLALSR